MEYIVGDEVEFIHEGDILVGKIVKKFIFIYQIERYKIDEKWNNVKQEYFYFHVRSHRVFSRLPHHIIKKITLNIKKDEN